MSERHSFGNAGLIRDPWTDPDADSGLTQCTTGKNADAGPGLTFIWHSGIYKQHPSTVAAIVSSIL